MSICRHFTSDFGPELEPMMTGPHQRQSFERAYKMGPLLGKGGFGTVFAGERTKDSLPVAVKVIKKAKITQWCKVGWNLKLRITEICNFRLGIVAIFIYSKTVLYKCICFFKFALTYVFFDFLYNVTD